MAAIFMICNLMTNQSVTTLPRLKTLQIQYSRHFKKNDDPVVNRRFDTSVVFKFCAHTQIPTEHHDFSFFFIAATIQIADCMSYNYL